MLERYGTTPFSNVSVNTSSEFKVPPGSSASLPAKGKTKETKNGNTPIGLNPRQERSTFEKRHIPESETLLFEKSEKQNNIRKSKTDEIIWQYPESQNNAASDDELNSAESINMLVSNAKKVSFSFKNSALLSSYEDSCEMQPQVGIGSVAQESQQRSPKNSNHSSLAIIYLSATSIRNETFIDWDIKSYQKIQPLRQMTQMRLNKQLAFTLPTLKGRQNLQ